MVTLKKIVISPAQCNGRSDKGKIWKHNPLQISKEVFESAGVPDVPKSTQCRVLRRIGEFGKPEFRPPLKNIHKKKRMDWAKE